MPLQNTPECFAAQLREGHYNELRVALYFMLRGNLVRIGFCDGRYDLQVQPPGKPELHVEVKWDKRAGETGNLYFEVENTRQRCPSGVMSTTADWWCHVLGDGDEALLVEVKALRAFLASGGFRSVHTQGADSNSRGLLVPRARLSALSGALWVRLPTVESFFGEVFRSGGA
ncbi:MAG: hypothetical protein ACOX6T_08285 [Myxococcales bacterium]|jgi:hypothetical protein